ncbi:MAG: hypothetical protein WBD40_08610 [Tepidisphaeraceae bacterium]
MTAQVTILTSSCAVLAADSAVTVSSNTGQKVYTGVEKIYPLSESRPTAALVYGSASLIGVPWGTLLSEFRQRFGDLAYTNIDEQAQRLLAFLAERLDDRITANGQEMREARVAGLMSALLSEARDRFVRTSMEAESNEEFVPEKVVAGIGQQLRDILAVERANWNAAERSTNLTESAERAHHAAARPNVNAIRKQVFAGLSLRAAVSRAVTDVALLSLTRQTPSGITSPSEGGLVLVGFPEGDFWPKYVEFTFDGVGLPGLRYWWTSSGGCEGPHDPLVHAFAQADGVMTIMNGIHPEYLAMLDTRLEIAGFDTEEIARVFKDTRDRWEQRRTSPILDTLDVMPPPDLCEVAESLVAITALWQRMRGALETVGGTISVAVLAPGGPLRWAKRPTLSSS